MVPHIEEININGSTQYSPTAQLVPTAQLEKNVIKAATKQHKDKLYFKRESIDTSNIIEGK